MEITLQHSDVTLLPDRSRVLMRPFSPSNDSRCVKICARVLSLSEPDVQAQVTQLMAEFGERHHQIKNYLLRRFEEMKEFLLTDEKLSEERRLLIGAYFTHEYSLEGAALFNPSMVPHPDQSDLPPGSLRFVLSLRATGEGHISSITFRTGVVDAEGRIQINTPTHFCLEPTQSPNAVYEKGTFERKLRELGLMGDFNGKVFSHLGETFTLLELTNRLQQVLKETSTPDHGTASVARETLTLAQSNYEVHFLPESRLSERVLFPVTAAQSHGIEDARFVLFREDDGTTCYHATYTAYDGSLILPQFLETRDFVHFRFITLNGPAVQNKGMALFPRRINGLYAMVSRQDYENIYVMYSDHLHFWHTTALTVKPTLPWEFIQLGNCGSPIETDRGWLVLSHGVGPMRKYCLGAFLLQLDDPTKVIGRLREPLIKPDENTREGYVPNVVYSCGSLLHGKHLVIPYAMSDYATKFATVRIEQLLDAME